MLDRSSQEQPSLQSFVQRISHELGAKALILLHENGQILHRSGWVEEEDYPSMAALVSAMIAAGKSLGSLGDNFLGSPSRFSCDSELMGLYTVAVSDEVWLAVLYDQPLNPGQFRMKVRRFSESLAKLGGLKSAQWEVGVTTSDTSSGVRLSPVSSGATFSPEKITSREPTLFANITDEEIDELFDNARA